MLKELLPEPKPVRDNLWAAAIQWLMGASVLGVLSAAAAYWKGLSPAVQWACYVAAGALGWTALGAWILRRHGLLAGSGLGAGDTHAAAARVAAEVSNQLQPLLSRPDGPIAISRESIEALVSQITAQLRPLVSPAVTVDSPEAESQEPPPAPQPKVNADAVNRLKEALGRMEKAWIYADEFISAEICHGAASFRGTKDAATGIRELQFALLARQLLGFVLQRSEVSRSRLADAVADGDDWTRDHFDRAIGAAMSMLLTYGDTLTWLKKAGDADFGAVGFLAHSGYPGLYERHKACIEELQRISSRDDIGRLALRLKDLPTLDVPTPPPAPAALSIEPLLDTLIHCWPNSTEPSARLGVAFSRRQFVVLRVRNVTGRNFVGAIARLTFSGGATSEGRWSEDSGPDYVGDGARKASLDVEDPRLLIVAACMGEHQVVVRLDDGAPVHSVPFETTTSSALHSPAATSGGLLVHSYVGRTSGTDLTIGASVELSVRIVAEGLDQTARYRIEFMAGQPKITEL